jgi:O-acetyl-ADP-ribose deacetylase (regulator of RNase III)
MKIVNKDITTADEPIIIHQVNCQNAMGSGVAKALFTKWYKVKSEYYAYNEMMFKLGYTNENLLGHILPIEVEENKIVINCYSQLNYGNDGTRHTSYDAIKECFNKINKNFPDGNIAIPYMYGCGLGGGTWDIVLSIITEFFGDRAVLYKI